MPTRRWYRRLLGADRQRRSRSSSSILDRDPVGHRRLPEDDQRAPAPSQHPRRNVSRQLPGMNAQMEIRRPPQRRRHRHRRLQRARRGAGDHQGPRRWRRGGQGDQGQCRIQGRQGRPVDGRPRRPRRRAEQDPCRCQDDRTDRNPDGHQVRRPSAARPWPGWSRARPSCASRRRYAACRPGPTSISPARSSAASCC